MPAWFWPAMWVPCRDQPKSPLNAPKGQRMSQGASSPYPITTSIAAIMDKHGFSRVEFIQALGYRNIERGRRRLDSWLDRGEGYERILNQIAAVYPAHAEALEKAVAEAAKVKAAEAEAA